MAGFCRQCGSPADPSSKFCQKCGTALGQRVVPTGSSQVSPATPAPPATPPQGTRGVAGRAAKPAAAGKPMGAGMKVVIALIVVFFLGMGAVIAGMAYVAHRVNEKVHEVIADTGSSAGTTRPIGNPCRLLSGSDVSAGIGVEIVKVEAVDGGCNFYAKGDQADMASRHVAAMIGNKGADAKAQKMMQQLSSQMIRGMQAPPAGSDSGNGGAGNSLVLNYSLDDNNAAAQMKLNRAAMKHIGGEVTDDLDGIGDEAFVTGDSVLMFRKGNKMVRVMYMNCPCNLHAVIPLVKRIAAGL
jgi:zinc-ribbon domain